MVLSQLTSHILLVCLRFVYFVSCKRFIQRSLLLTQLSQFITSSNSNNQLSTGRLTAVTSNHPISPSTDPIKSKLTFHQSDSLSSLRLNHNHHHHHRLSRFTRFTSWISDRLRLLTPVNSHHWSDPLLPLSSNPSQPTTITRSSNADSRPIQLSQPQQISTSLATLLFCWAFCEGGLLFSIVILGSVLDPIARNINWNLSLALLISSVVFIVPFLECLLLSASLCHRASGNEMDRLLSARTVTFTLIPFAIYLFIYYRAGQTIQGLLGVETGSHSFGFLNTTLARICVPGVFLIASLSGGGAVNTAWETWEWHHREKEPRITEQQIVTAEQALYRTRMDLAERQSSLLQQQQSITGESSGSGIMNVLTGVSNSKLANLQQEISGLQAMETQMTSDVIRMNERREYSEYSRTIPGMLLKIANWSLSVYCVYRLFMACVNLIFGYVKRPVSDDEGSLSKNPTTDIVTYLIAKVLSTFNVQLDLMKLSRLVGLVLIGSIIIVNLRAVLMWVHRIFNRVSSRGVSSNMMLLVLGQLMATYLLTCLISLPASGINHDKESSSTADLLSTLPSFHRFSKLFDIVFLSTGILTALVRWLGKQIAQNL
ncbi:Abscisic acid G-protein coupled receptor-domain-containing protein [Phakopsora pachyrhizi]|uniref:Abscisic acid G-protein coupled receptor-domain-containing protein n=1 Tax=Phakopsora pachyrhizi TaxID=170000 RepID=A0AAV0AM21_PHAPC|nr:Abscisic acid G-protein coupled receptor-domain-containing protein [Phakopsora pachyrhizi]